MRPSRFLSTHRGLRADERRESRFDIIKTRLQTSNFEARASSPSSSSAAATPSTAKPIISKHLSIRSVASGIHQDGVTSHRFTYRTSLLYSFLSRSVFPPASIARGGKADPRAEKWTLRVLGLKGYARGLRPTVVSSFVGSAVTISEFVPLFLRPPMSIWR